MKYLSVIAIIILASCITVKSYPIRGNYPAQPFEISSTQTFDQAWDKLIDLFAQKGLPIKIIDRSSGLIISDRTALKATNEDKNLLPRDKNSWIVVPYVYSFAKNKKVSMESVPNVYGEWNVRIKKMAEGVLINVNIVNVVTEEPASYKTPATLVRIPDYKSTGVFENIIATFIK